MARAADFGLMIWDGKSSGTVLNVLRLVRAGKISVLFDVAGSAVLNFKSAEHWQRFLAKCTTKLITDIRERATEDEWGGEASDPQASLFAECDEPIGEFAARQRSPSFEEAVSILNRALVSGDAATAMHTLGTIARDRGMSQIARDTGLARESLYRSLDAGGNPEFATVVKVLSSIGLHLEAKAEERGANPNPATI